MAETMRGMRLGAQSLESDRGVELSERQKADFRCPNGHEFSITFSATAELPASWDCRNCDSTAVRVADGVEVESGASEPEGPRTHYDMVLERRSRAELEELLEEMLTAMRKRRSEGRLSA